MGDCAGEMPRYKCHKEVWALKIANIKSDGEGCTALILPEDARYAVFKVSADYMEKHKPEVGGYYVVYKDGYLSYSPAEAFEEGYTLVK